MTEKKVALLVDVDNVKIDFESFKNIINQAQEIGEIVYGKLYGFSDRKHRAFVDYVASQGYETAATMRLKKRNKSQLDCRIIIDGVQLALTNPNLDAYVIVTGYGDIMPLITYLKSLGKYVAGAFVGGVEVLPLCHSVIEIPSQAGFLGVASNDEFVAEVAPKKVVSVPKKVAPKVMSPVFEEPEIEEVQVNTQDSFDAIAQLEAMLKNDIVEDEEIMRPVLEETEFDDTPDELLKTIERLKEEVVTATQSDETNIDDIMTKIQGMSGGTTTMDELERSLQTKDSFSRNDEDDDVFNISQYMLSESEDPDEAKTASFSIEDSNIRESLDNIKTMMAEFENDK